MSEADDSLRPVRVGVIGLGTRGTSLLRTVLEIPGTQVVALCDRDARHRTRAAGIVEKACGSRIDADSQIAKTLERPDLDAVLIALPCDLHGTSYAAAIRAGKHVYAEKPLALTLTACDELITLAEANPKQVFHVGYQRRSNPRYRDGVALLRRGEIGDLISATGAWVSSNGPMNGHEDWLASRSRSGDWMVEQGVHVWDILNWIAGGPPVRAFGQGRQGLFTHDQPARDVTDHYSVQVEWASGLTASFVHSWVAPADDRFTGVHLQVFGTEGGFDFASGALTYRDRRRARQSIHPEVQPDTRLAIEAFADAVRSETPASPPVSLAEARDATLAALLIRAAVDERRVVCLDEVTDGARRTRTV